MSHPITQETIPEPGAPGAILARVPAFKAVRDIIEGMRADHAILQVGKWDKPLTWEQKQAAQRFLATAKAQGYRAEVIDNEYVFIARVIVRNRRRQES